MNKVLFLMLICFGFFYACETWQMDTGNDPLIGTWVFSSYQPDINAYEFKAMAALDKDLPGFIFLENGQLVSRQNSGWCGTPPVVYGDFSGEWQYLNDSTLYVITAYWGTEINGQKLENIYLILELAGDRLVLKQE